MKPKPFSALNHFTVPVAITNFLQERFVDPDCRGRSSRCSSSAPDWNKAHPRHKAASVQDVRCTATTGWRLPQTGEIPPVVEDNISLPPRGRLAPTAQAGLASSALPTFAIPSSPRHVHPASGQRPPHQRSPLRTPVRERLVLKTLRRLTARPNHPPPGHRRAIARHHRPDLPGAALPEQLGPVSYTHLTLPTIYSV